MLLYYAEKFGMMVLLSLAEPTKEEKTMAYCKRCGAPISDQAMVCPSCGAEQYTPPTMQDNGGIGWGILGCCIPIVGLVLFLVWKDQKPKTAKAAGLGALVAVILGALWYVVALVGGIGLALIS